MKRILNKLPLIWTILGFIIIITSLLGYQMLMKSENNAQYFQHLIDTKLIKQSRKKSNFDANQIKPVTTEAYIKAQLNYSELINKNSIGSIYIPAANIQTKILSGMANENLIVGVGTYRKNQKLGRNNYVVLAHNLVQGGGSLHRLGQAKLGSIIYATDFSRIYEYRVTINKIEKQTNGILLRESRDNESAKITLFRCEGGLNTPNRMVAQGMFIKSYPAEQATKNVRDGLGLLKTVKTSDSRQLNNNSQNMETNYFVQTHKTRLRIQVQTIRVYRLVYKYTIWIAIVYLLGIVILIAIKNKYQNE